MTTSAPATAAATPEGEDRTPELHIHLKSGVTLRATAAGGPPDVEDMDWINQQLTHFKECGTAIFDPADGWTSARLLIVPWESVDYFTYV